MRLTPSDCGYVAVGACGGALLRYSAGEFGKAKGNAPMTILLVNVLGSFLLGGATAAVPGTRASLLVGTGFCGAFTTFSTYAVDVVQMANGPNGIPAAAALAIATNTLSVGAAAAGMHLGASPAVGNFVSKLPPVLRLPPKGPIFPSSSPPR